VSLCRAQYITRPFFSQSFRDAPWTRPRYTIVDESANPLSETKGEPMRSLYGSDSIVQMALNLREAGLSIIPVTADKTPDGRLLPLKRDENGEPIVKRDRAGNPRVNRNGELVYETTWEPFKTRLATPDEIRTWFGPAKGIGIIGGRVSSQLVQLDFEGKTSDHQPMTPVFDDWNALVLVALADAQLTLASPLSVCQTPSGGYHVRWRVETDDTPREARDLRLACEPWVAARFAVDPDTGEIQTDAKGKPIRDKLIETKNEGGYCLCPPSEGYREISGDLTNIATVSMHVHTLLMDVARSFHSAVLPETEKRHNTATHASAEHGTDGLRPANSSTITDCGQVRPGDDYNEHGDHHALLTKHNWILAHTSGDVEYWKRPGTLNQWSANWNYIPNRFHVFSTSTDFEHRGTYDKFSLYAHLSHDGDYSQAAKALASQGYGEQWSTRKNRKPAPTDPADEIRSMDMQLAEVDAPPPDEMPQVTLDTIKVDIKAAAGLYDDPPAQAEAITKICHSAVTLPEAMQDRVRQSLLDAKLFTSKTDANRAFSEARRNRKEAEKEAKAQTAKAQREAILSLDVRSSGNVFEATDHYYKQVKDGEDYIMSPLSSFRIEPKIRIWLDGQENLSVDFVTRSQTYADKIIRRRAWNTNERFMDALPSIDLHWLGKGTDVQNVLAIVSSYDDVPSKQGTPKLGYHESGEWMLPDGTAYTADGKIDTPELIYLPVTDHGELDSRIHITELSESEYQAFIETLYQNIFALNHPEVIFPVVGWFLATPFKPQIQKRYRGFPILSIAGRTGAGKSSLLDLFWSLMGVNGKLFSCTETDFVMLKLLSATTSIPIALDEYKPYDMPPLRLRALTRLLRKAYDGETELKGRADQGTNEYVITAPVAMAGVQPLTEGELLERILTVTPQKHRLSDVMREAYHQIRNLPLSAFMSRYIPFALGVDVLAELARAEALAAELVPRFNEAPDRVRKNLTVATFGFNQFLAFGQTFDIHCEDFTSVLGKALNTALEAVCGVDGVTTDALDLMIKHLAIMAETGRLTYGTHYVVRDTYQDIALRFNACFAEFRKYYRETQLDTELLNEEGYQILLKENHARKGYITERNRNVKFRGDQQKAVIVSPILAEAVNLDLSGFFGNEENE
jgi:hypothetical protein